MSKITGQILSGSFAIEGRQIHGVLNEAGEKTKLHLHDREFFHLPDVRETYVHGQLHNLVRVSLLDCLTPGTGSLGLKNERMNTADVFPHYVVSGDLHLAPQDNVISQIEFCLNDADMLFYDYDAFGEVIHGEKFIEEIANANNRPDDPKVETGPHPHIFYFTGVYEMANFATELGTFTARHSPSYRWPGPWGMEFNNSIVTALGFERPVDFRTALQRLIDLRRYLELLIGRPQNVTGITLVVPVTGQEHPHRLDVDWSLLRKYDYSDEQRRPQPRGLLMDPIREKTQFASITAAYFSRTKDWETARWRFASNFEDSRHYTIDRLVSAAHMFDVLPDHVFGSPPVLNDKLLAAKTVARDAFKALPDDLDRASILNALGRLGKWTLKKKIASRLEKFSGEADDRLPELALVTEQAVNARNYFVHGGKKDFDYAKYDRILWFFVDTLEFVFAVSDLAEAGWSVKAWADRASVSHRFGSYVYEYRRDLILLKKALAEGI